MPTKQKETEEPKPVMVDIRYLCPNDPNRQKIIDAGGLVLPEDGPLHQAGWITEQKNISQKKRTFREGREVEFTIESQTAKRICQRCGGETLLDPYP